MRPWILLVLLSVSDISGFTLKQIHDKLNFLEGRMNYVEDRLNRESKFRREDSATLFKDLNSIRTMLQQTQEDNDHEKDSASIQILDNSWAAFEYKVSRLLKAFREEKNANIQIRHEIPGIKTEIQDLRSKIEQINKSFKEEVQRSVSLNLEQSIKTLQEDTKKLSKQMEHLQEQQESLEQEMKTNSTNYSYCNKLFIGGQKNSGVYEIEPVFGRTISVYCDMKTDGGGWTVFQRRKDGSVDFYRNWENYKAGFGDLNGEFWLGNEYLHILTNTTEIHELRVDLEDHDGYRAYAKYSRFKVGSESENFKLEVTGYSGDAGDSLSLPPRENYHTHDGMEFTTMDRDNDETSINCAIRYKGAWWYNNCFASNLNGLYHKNWRCIKTWVCIVWYTWKGEQYSLKFTEMKLR